MTGPSAIAPELTRIALDPERMEQELSRLVLTLVEFVRRLLEAQALRRLDAGTLSDAEAERLGLGLKRAREAVLTICDRLQIAPETLNLDLGPLGRLL
jgi:hypothetical protein